MAAENIDDQTVQGAGGYECDFVEPPPDDLFCKICQCPPRDAQQANSCCGQNFCKKCLDRYLDTTTLNTNICPFCREPDFQFVPDRRAQRQVLNIRVYCPNQQLGCTWSGELRTLEKHSKENCPYTETQCECGVMIQRKLLQDHSKSTCRLRQVNCEFCNITGSYEWISDEHQNECPKHLAECPNHCDVGHVKRENMTEHLKECQLAVVECPFAVVGCTDVITRRNKLLHMKENVEQHMEYNKNAVFNIQQELIENKKIIESKDNQLKTLQQSLNNTQERLHVTEKELETVKQELKNTTGELQSQLESSEAKLQQLHSQFESYIKRPIWSTALHNSSINAIQQRESILLVKVDQFEHKRKLREGWYSPSFLTSKRGYKMCLYFNLDGLGTGRSTHISVGVFIMKGENDGNLSWPVKGTLHIQLLNQAGDNDHIDATFQFGSNTGYSQRVTTGNKSFSACYCDQIIAHDELSHNAKKNTQYLKDDCVFFLVVSFIPMSCT
ncbi:TNF receptor-associated factor 3-like [Dysidea avara]|uniref:TNF receptor-associated factor 3-like n=1 Tax=Dysidea avara TaxID=196820 RepID=UPI00331D2CDE